MAGQEEPMAFETSFSVELARDQSPRPIRQDTGSTDGSEKYIPMPTGFYTIPIHGNCPRCHHYHKAATIRIKITGDSSHASHVRCEKCGHKWLAFGGVNSTRISLLSTQSIEPDSMETTFRYTLINMVRSATAVASPSALASVPEASSRLPSREHSQHQPNNHSIPEHHPHHDDPVVSEQGVGQAPASNARNATPPALADRPVLDEAVSIHDAKQIKRMYASLKRKLKEKFPVFAKLSRNVPKMNERSRGKLPAAPSKTIAQASAFEGRLPERESAQNYDVNDRQIPQGMKCTCAADTIESLNSLNKEEIQHMNREEQFRWIRRKYTAFKCRCPNDCTCNPASHKVDRSTQVQVAHLLSFPPIHPPRRRSCPHDLLFLGTHFDAPPGPISTHPATLSIADTWNSQADTAVDSQTATSYRPRSFLSVIERHRPRSMSPRPQSPGNPPQSWQQLRQQGLGSRSSTDSFATGGAVRSLAGFGRLGTEQYSVVSLTPTISLPTIDASPSQTQIRASPDNSSGIQDYTQMSTMNLNEHYTTNE